MALDFSNLESVIRQDPSGRGVAGYRHHGQWLATGMLKRAALHLAEHSDVVGIVTGFCIVDVEPPVAETDGPPGALYLARALKALGNEVVLLSDASGLELLRLGCRLWALDAEIVDLAALSSANEQISLGDFLPPSLANRVTHLVAIERVGPSHTPISIRSQPGNSREALAQFEAEVPCEHHDHCHNMRGRIIDSHSAPTHRLFETVKSSGERITTIGIGDGGNEIGMGSLPWQVLRAALQGPHAGQIICRIPTDYLLLAGISNWGAYALACATASLCGRGHLIAEWNEGREHELIEHLVSAGGAVDGLTRRRESTVDGLSLETYLAVLKQIRDACSW